MRPRHNSTQNWKWGTIGTVKRFEELDVRQDARQVARVICSASRQRSFYADCGLRDQIRRASISILSNIAEGFERGTKKEFVRYLTIAKASSGELRAQLYAALDPNYLRQEEYASVRESHLTLSREFASFIRYFQGCSTASRPKRTAGSSLEKPATCHLPPATH
jgi:four helix bundle protein